MRTLNLALILLLTGVGSRAFGGEALVTRVRGGRVMLDAGAAAGLSKGMEIKLFRPPGETIYHPITGEDLGAPEVEIAGGVVTKVSEHASSVHLKGEVLMGVRPGDVARFTTPDEQMLMAEERTIATREENQREHRQFRQEIARLKRSISSTQGRIGGLQKLVRRIERIEDGFRVQLRGINEDLVVMKKDVRDLKDQMTLYARVPVPVAGDSENPQGSGPPGLTAEDVEKIVQQAMEQQQAAAVPANPPADTLGLGEDLGEEDLGIESEAGAAEEKPLYARLWFLFLVVGVIGIAAVGAFLYLRMSAVSEEDEEEEEDEVMDEDEDGIEIEAEDAEEEDGIVVEETS